MLIKVITDAEAMKEQPVIGVDGVKINAHLHWETHIAHRKFITTLDAPLEILKIAVQVNGGVAAVFRQV